MEKVTYKTRLGWLVSVPGKQKETEGKAAPENPHSARVHGSEKGPPREEPDKSKA